jgi:hypothetical protein
MNDTKITGQSSLSPVHVPDTGSSGTADTSAGLSSADTHTTPRETVTSKRRRGSRITNTKSSPKARVTKKQQLSKERALKQKQHDREFLIKYMAFMNRYQDYIDAKEEFVKNYREAGGTL